MNPDKPFHRGFCAYILVHQSWNVVYVLIASRQLSVRVLEGYIFSLTINTLARRIPKDYPILTPSIWQ